LSRFEFEYQLDVFAFSAILNLKETFLKCSDGLVQEFFQDYIKLHLATAET